MKPLTLTMSAFGPYEKETVIDFRKFDNSLFLITGRTGSGKTTIFDGIMYSLFGEVSGGERKAPEMRTKFVDAKTVTRIKLEFEHNGELYTVERVIRSSAKSADATLKCPGKTVEGLKKVNDYIPELIGITPDQFRGVVMLAQGKFRELLSAKSDDRAAILRKIFNTDIYKLFQARLKEKAADTYSSYQKDLSSLETMIRGLSCPEDMTSLSIFLENPVVGTEAMERLFSAVSELEKEDKEKLSVLGEKIAAGDLQYRAVAGDVEKARDTNKRLENLQKEKEILTALLQKENYYLSLENETKVTRKAEKVAAVEDAWKKSRDNVALFTRTVQEKTVFIKENTPEVKLWLKKVEDLEKSQEPEEWQKEKGKLELAIPQYDELEQTLLALTKNEKIRKTKEDGLALAAKEVVQLNEKIQKSEDTFKTLDRAELLKSEKDATLERVENKCQMAVNLEIQLHNLEMQKTDAENAKKESDAARDLFTSLEKTAVDLENRLWDGQAGVLAEKLQEGEACPVCGSLVHPHPAVKPAEVPTKTAVDSARKKAENARKAADTAVAKTGELQARYDANAQNLAKSVKEGFGDSIEVSEDILSVAPQLLHMKKFLEKQKEDITEDIRELDKQCKLRSELQKLIPELQEEKKQKESLQEREKEELQKINGEIKGLAAKKDTIAKGLPYPTRKEAEQHIKDLDKKASEYLANLNQAKEKCATLKTKVDRAAGEKENAEKSLETARSIEEKEHTKFLYTLRESGFADEEAYQTALLNLVTLDKDEKNLAAYHRELDMKKGSVETMERDTKGLYPVDISLLTAKETELKTALDALRLQHGEVQHRLQDNAKHLKQIKDAWSISEKTMEEYNALLRLSSVANGEGGGNKLDLERYIMASFFDDVLANANRKLAGMTDGRYQLRRAGDSGDKRKTTGLDIEVIDRYTLDSARGTQTLSGGESFMAALSLALGLSDAIQQSAGGISINALFVDEGFDSLDTDTLQEVLKVLQGLTTGNRMVGIISHVESLKEQIEKKIVVTKLGDGKSVARMEG